MQRGDHSATGDEEMKDGEAVSLRVGVPICSFRKGTAREYLETEEVPPPSTIYGFLLSLVGEEDRRRYLGTKIACAILKKPVISLVLRTVWRTKDAKVPPGTGSNRRPDYQEILTGLEFAVWVELGELSDRVVQAGADPSRLERFGGLSLGESRDLVNDIEWSPRWLQNEGQWLVNDPQGEIALPVWVDHVGSKGTVWRQFNLEPRTLSTPPAEDPRWIAIVDK
jgi:CRISPR-associated protein Cas5t